MTTAVSRETDIDQDDDVCAVCGCFRWYCEGPGRYDDLFDAETTCRCWDDELGEPTC